MSKALKTRRLSGREESFCQLMSILGDDSLPQKECAVEAGYGRAGAHVRASQLMKRVRIRDRIEDVLALAALESEGKRKTASRRKKGRRRR